VSVLRTIEQKIESLVEGVFGRAFRTNVQPVELARKLVKEMDDHRTTSVSRTYVPNEYTVHLSPLDREQFASYEESLKLELQEYLAEHARREGYVMLSPPVVLIETEADLAVGEFGISTRMAQRGRQAGLDGEPPASGATMIYRQPRVADDEAALAETPEAAISVDGQRRPLGTERVLIGRSPDCDIRLEDANVSRRHAEIRREDSGYVIVDLGSTNGMEVNGRRVRQAQLEHSDRITLGSTQLVFEQAPVP
jgi:hypothetical protein